MGDKQLEFLDILSILSFYVGYENLIGKQNEMLTEILEAVRK